MPLIPTNVKDQQYNTLPLVWIMELARLQDVYLGFSILKNDQREDSIDQQLSINCLFRKVETTFLKNIDLN